jgi:hypothetical protein
VRGPSEKKVADLRSAGETWTSLLANFEIGDDMSFCGFWPFYSFQFLFLLSPVCRHFHVLLTSALAETFFIDLVRAALNTTTITNRRRTGGWKSCAPWI